MPWSDIYAGLAEKNGWKPWEVDRLTMYQALVYLGARDREFRASTRPSTAAELEAYARQNEMQKHGV